MTFKKLVIYSVLLLTTPVAFAQSDNLTLLKQMFQQMVVKKDIKLAPKFYAKDFVLHTNGIKMSYKQFYNDHAKIYKTPIQYKIRYDRQTLVESGNKIAGRVFISVKAKPKAKWKKIEVILVAVYHHGKIAKLWELTYPNWSKMPTFKKA